jgi:menaquinone-dependent protoporphyrinogen oxidase
MKVLIAYASRHGATRGIAEKIADTLRRHELDVSLQPVDAAADVATYDAFVIGAAAYYNRWMKEAARFVRDHRDLLADRPVWLFSSGPVGTDLVDDKGRNVLEAAEPKEFEEFVALIGPRADRVFFGAYDPDNPPTDLAERVVRMLPAIKKLLPTGDFRDWAEIEAWAEGIAAELAPATAAAEAVPA